MTVEEALSSPCKNGGCGKKAMFLQNTDSMNAALIDFVEPEQAEKLVAKKKSVYELSVDGSLEKVSSKSVICENAMYGTILF